MLPAVIETYLLCDVQCTLPNLVYAHMNFISWLYKPHGCLHHNIGTWNKSVTVTVLFSLSCRHQHLRLEAGRSQPCTHIWTQSQKQPFPSASIWGISRHINMLNTLYTVYIYIFRPYTEWRYYQLPSILADAGLIYTSESVCDWISVCVQIAGLLGVFWCVSLLSCLFSNSIPIPMQANPVALYGFFLLFLINPFKTCYYKSRFWLLKLLVTSLNNKLYMCVILRSEIYIC